jgi:phenylpropionate dioxygenase-like ring-hydroxylating dioxygenase large terminal subunit
MSDTFDWRSCWHPVVFSGDVPAGRPLAFSLHDEPFVLFRDGAGRIACLEDRCPHRLARLSRGRVVDGVLECGYHGWRFGGDGACVHIPQLPPGQPLPEGARAGARAAVERQGVVWVWAGHAGDARPADLPLVEALDRPGVTHVDYATDLPYGHEYLVENVIDVAHIHIAHDGVRGGGHRSLALPLDFEVLEDSPRGLRAEFRSQGPGARPAASPLASASVEFRAPGLVHYASHYRDPARIAGLALYALPLGAGRCRLLYRKYSNFYSRREAWKPRWLEHWTQNTILRQDMAIISGQAAAIERSGRELRDLWLPIRSSDRLVVRYRQWLDRYAPAAGPFRGFATHADARPHAGRGAEAQSLSRAAGDDALPGTFELHTRQCASCLRAWRTARRVRWLLLAAAAVLLPAMLVATTARRGVSLWALYGAALAAAWACRAFERRFE